MNVVQFIHFYLGVGLKYVLFSPLPLEDSQFDQHTFQMGWFNHQLGIKYTPRK